MKVSKVFFFIFLLFSFFGLKPATTFVYEKLEECTELDKFIDDIYACVEKKDEVEPFVCFNPLDKITSVECMIKACFLALKTLKDIEAGKNIKFLCFGRTFNIVFLASMLLDDECENLLMQNLDGVVCNLVEESPFSFVPKDRVSNLCEKFETLFAEYDKKKDYKTESDLFDEKGLNDVLFLEEFNRLFKFCRSKILELKKEKDSKHLISKDLILNVVTLLAPNYHVFVVVGGQEREVKTNEFCFKPSDNVIKKISNLYASYGIGKILIGDAILPFENTHESFINVFTMNDDEEDIKSFVLTYLNE